MYSVANELGGLAEVDIDIGGDWSRRKLMDTYLDVFGGQRARWTGGG
jgi:hypothetical protein